MAGMKLKGAEPRLAHEYGYGWRFSFHVEEESLEVAKSALDELKDGYISIDVDKYRQQRSLSANAYAWVLIDKIAYQTKQGKTDVYRHAVREVGGNTETICIMNKGVDRLRRSWEKNGLGWATDTTDSRLDGCTNVILYYGSSTFDTAQMATFIDGLIQDCKALGIEHLSPNEITRMMNQWQKADERKPSTSQPA